LRESQHRYQSDDGRPTPRYVQTTLASVHTYSVHL